MPASNSRFQNEPAAAVTLPASPSARATTISGISHSTGER